MNKRQQPTSSFLEARSLRVVVPCVMAVVLTLALLLAGCSSDTGQAPSEKVQTMLQDRFTAMNAGDTTAVAKCYATNAVLDNYGDGGTNIQGSVAIADYYLGSLKDFDMRWGAAGDPIQYDRYVIQQVKMWQPTGTGTGAAVHVLEMDSNGQIAHEWIVAWAKG